VRDSRKLEDPPPEQPEDAGFGATRRLIVGDAGGVKIRGNPEIRHHAAEGCEIRGNSKIHRRKSRKMQDSGQPEDSSSAMLEE